MCLHVALSLQASSPFRDIVKNRRARGDAKAEGGGGGEGLGEKGELATITHKFSIPPGNLGTPQSVKTVTANVPQLIVFTTNGSSPQPLAFFIRKIEWSTLHGTLCKWHQI